jgi:GDP-4-dehydro-6-deoxy-D-mannose reductase
MRIFVTGITGFVGAHLVRELTSRGGEVFGTCYPREPEDWNACDANNVRFLDIRKESDLSALVATIQPDWVFHLAAISNVKHSWERRKETLETNLTGTFHLFEALRQHAPHARTLYVSSSDVYGVVSPVADALTEQDTLNPVNPYALTKVGGEILCRFYSQIENLDIVVARPFSHTGPGQSPDFVCSDWAHQIAKIEKDRQNARIKVGNIDVRRDFLDVRDVVVAYGLLMEKGKKGEIYNISSGDALSLREILTILLSFSAEAIEIEVDPQRTRKVDIPLLVGNSRKFRKLTSWEPQIPLSQSLHDLLEYWRSRL